MRFSYRAYSRTGDLSEGEIIAADAESVREKLWADGLTPFEIQARAEGGPRFELEKQRGVLKLPKLAAFTRELATLESAGIPIDDALRIVAEQSNDRSTVAVATSLLKDLLAGIALSDSMRAQPSFSREYSNAVRAGELSGRLDEVLAELANLLERRLEVANKLRSAFIYPAILIVLALVSVFVVVSVLVPNVAPIFSEAGRPMPEGLRVIIALQAHFPEILAGLMLLGIFAASVQIAAARNFAFRLSLHSLYIRLPIVGSLIMKSDAARFSRTLGSLLRAGVPLLSAIETSGAGASNLALSEGVKNAIDLVRDGAPLNRALREIQRFPSMATRMIAVGEETGRLPMMLTRIAAILEGQVEQAITRAMSVVTPLLTVLIAGLVGALILSVMTAVLSINEIAVR